MDHDYSQPAAKHFWSKGTNRDVWSILDGARDNRISSYLLNSYLDYKCLYSGDLTRQLEAAAPYLVRIEDEDRVTRRLLKEGWGNSWGVFCKCSGQMDALRKHLRGFLLVRDPRGRRMVFRYYDPRVLRVYLPTCTMEELRTVFGPIDTFWVEGEEPDTLLEFAFDGRKLSQNVIALQASE